MVDSNTVLKNEYFKIKCESMCLAWHVGEAKEMQKDLVPKNIYICKVLPQFYYWWIKGGGLYESN